VGDGFLSSCEVLIGTLRAPLRPLPAGTAFAHYESLRRNAQGGIAGPSYLVVPVAFLLGPLFSTQHAWFLLGISGFLSMLCALSSLFLEPSLVAGAATVL